MSTEPTAPFLCVCGTPVSTATGSSVYCPHCGRHYSSAPDDPSLTWSFDGSTTGAVATDEDELIGRTLDHYRILNCLGRGGMGTVYRALDESLQRYVAVKLIRHRDSNPDDSSEAKRVSRLLQEARAQARINHANVVHVYFVSRDPELPYLAMELVPGETLAQRLAQGPLPFAETVSIGMQVATALGESARLDVTHGDIKPSNILLHGQLVKLSDFGLAQRLSHRPTEGRIAGTPSYMAPEVCRGESLSAQADMYALGVTLFEMSFGRSPYVARDRSITASLLMHQEAQVEFPKPWPEHLPEEWRQLLNRLMAKDPARRFSDWNTVVTELKRLQPIPLVPAGRVQRLVAWGIDFSLQKLGSAAAWLGVLGMREARPSMGIAMDTLEYATYLIGPVLMVIWISLGRRTPGKSLMRLRILDRYGLPPRRSTLAWRSIFQFMPLWILPIDLFQDSTNWVDLVLLLGWLTTWIYVFGNLLLAFGRSSRLAFHDQFLGTQVVLDPVE